MKICIDIQTAFTRSAGVGRYTLELVKSLDAIAQEEEIMLFYFNVIGRPIEINLSHSYCKTMKFLPGRVFRKLWEILKWPSYNFFTGTADIYHFPNFILPPLKNGKSVVTIHDLSFLRYPEYASKRYGSYLTSRIHDTVERADAIITDSMFSKKEIESLLKVNSDRLFKVYPGLSAQFFSREKDAVTTRPQMLNINRPYILTVSTLEPRKNISFLIEIFENLKRFDGNLIIAGMLGWKYEAILNRMHNSTRARDIIYLDYIADQELQALYSNAELFVFTSYYEGFGFPPLEAMACGTPVVSSTSGSLNEVLGEGAQLIDNFEIDSWIKNIEKLLFDSYERKNRIDAGFRRACLYTWENTAYEVMRIYKSIV